MDFRVGNKEIIDVKKGIQNINFVYHEDKLVWIRDGITPPNSDGKFMRTVPDNVYDQVDKGITSEHMFHDGRFILPQIGNKIYTGNDNTNLYVPINPIQYVGTQRYPADSEEELNIKIGGTNDIVSDRGKVIWLGWVRGKLSKPISLSFTKNGVKAITIKWKGASNYYNLRYRIFYRVHFPQGNWQEVKVVVNTKQESNMFYTEPFTNIGDSDWKIASIDTSEGTALHYEESEILHVVPDLSYSFMIGDTGSDSTACNSAPSFGRRWSNKEITNLVAGDIIYTDELLTTRFDGGNRFWRSDGGTISLRITTQGVVQGVSSCPATVII